MYIGKGEGLGQVLGEDGLSQCDPASAEGMTYLSIREIITCELRRKFTDPNDPGLYKRRLRLRELFKAVPPSDAQGLYDELQRKDSELSKLFHYRLATPTRNELFRVLRSGIGASQPEPAATVYSREKAAALFGRAADAFEAKEYRRAIALFEQIIQMQGLPEDVRGPTVFNIGAAYEKLGALDLRTAIGHYERYLAFPGIPDRDAVQKRIDALKRSLGTR